MAARRSDVIRADFTDSLIDLCCCALGGFVLLMVMVLPEPAKPQATEHNPIERTLHLSGTLPVAFLPNAPLSSTDPIESNGANVDKIRFPLAICGGELYLYLNDSTTSFYSVPIPAEPGTKGPIETMTPIGNVVVTFAREPTDSWPMYQSADNHDSKIQSVLRFDVAVSFAPDDPLLNEPCQVTLECKLKSRQDALPTALAQLWSDVISAEAALTIHADSLGDISGAFPMISAELTPGSESKSDGCSIIPFYAGPGTFDGQEWLGVYTVEKHKSNLTTIDGKAPSFYYNGFEHSVVSPSFSKTAQQSFFFSLKWIAALRKSTSEPSPHEYILTLDFIPGQ